MYLVRQDNSNTNFLQWLSGLGKVKPFKTQRPNYKDYSVSQQAVTS